MAHRLIVAIDGPAGAGKSTAARLLAARLGYALLDTGAIYRSMALRARERGVAWDDGPGVAALADGIDIAFRLDGTVNRVIAERAGRDGGDPDARDVRRRVARVGAARGARGAARAAAAHRRGGGVVVEGRDIGTVVFPDAEAKFFLIANTDERARRRVAELTAAGKPVDAEQTKAEIVARDTRDSTRATAPLRKADDAVEIDSSTLDADAVVARMADDRRRAQRASRSRAERRASAGRGACAGRGRPGATPRRRGRRGCGRCSRRPRSAPAARRAPG